MLTRWISGLGCGTIFKFTFWHTILLPATDNEQYRYHSSEAESSAAIWTSKRGPGNRQQNSELEERMRRCSLRGEAPVDDVSVSLDLQWGRVAGTVLCHA